MQYECAWKEYQRLDDHLVKIVWLFVRIYFVFMPVIAFAQAYLNSEKPLLEIDTNLLIFLVIAAILVSGSIIMLVIWRTRILLEDQMDVIRVNEKRLSLTESDNTSGDKRISDYFMWLVGLLTVSPLVGLLFFG